MIETILLSFIVAKIKGYKVSNIFKNWAIYPVIIMEIINILVQITIFNGNYSYVKIFSMMKPIYLSLYLGLIIRYEIYKQALIGVGFVFTGGLLNDIAIKANGGFMPVFPTLSYWTGYANKSAFEQVNDIHILGSAETCLKMLTDYIDLGYSVLSIGDILIRVFVYIVIFYSIKASSSIDIKESSLC